MEKLIQDLAQDHKLLETLREEVKDMERDVLERRRNRNSSVSVNFQLPPSPGFTPSLRIRGDLPALLSWVEKVQFVFFRLMMSRK